MAWRCSGCDVLNGDTAAACVRCGEANPSPPEKAVEEQTASASPSPAKIATLSAVVCGLVVVTLGQRMSETIQSSIGYTLLLLVVGVGVGAALGLAVGRALSKAE